MPFPSRTSSTPVSEDRRVFAPILALLAGLALTGCGGDAPLVASPSAVAPVGLKAVLAPPNAVSVASVQASGPLPATSSEPVPKSGQGRPSHPPARPPQAVAVAQAVSPQPRLDPGQDQSVVPSAFAAPAQAEPSASAYAPSSPVAPVADLLSVLQSGQRLRGPALLPAVASAPAVPLPMQASDGAPQANPVESVRASVAGPAVATSVLSAPGMVMPDRRVQDALSRRGRHDPGEAGSAVSQRDLEGLF